VGAAVIENGLGGHANTPPFRFRNWLFAQDAPFDRFEEIRPLIEKKIPDFLRRNIRGHSAGEYLFHLFLSLLHDSGSEDQRDLATAKIRRALRDALELFSAAAKDKGLTSKVGNIVITNGRTMLAVRLAQQPLSVRYVHELPESKRPETEVKAVVVVRKNQGMGEGFEIIPNRCVAEIDHQITLNVVDLND